MGSTSRALAQAGVALLAVYLVILLGVVWPVQLLAPAFQLRIGTQLINAAPMALIGLALLQLGSALNPDDRWLKNLHQRAASLALVAVIGFLLLIPLLSVASLRQQRSEALSGSAQLRRADAQLRLFRQALDASTSHADLEQRFRALQGPRLDALDRSLPMPQLRARASSLLDQLAAQLQRRRSQLPSANPWQKLPEILRTGLGALVLAAGFAALARRPRQWISLLEEGQKFWSDWQDHRRLRRLRRLAQGGRSRGSAPPD